ncbi:hypothetical protein [Gemella haemolysans]|jgi:hypothetical protein|uniref:DUF4064 domain-containing protein n=2 Tax=Gemella haemolysans TaxID=1379 RepID=A0AA87DQJ6_9BACL|nr:hypothetical protein [Gemella haemolysans]EGF86754.1 hypothetical protein HMPREF0428_01551 [Gemella haemolysans M341]QIX88731.1 hypothetical protein FOC48_08165 [Gemella haemolysans]
MKQRSRKIEKTLAWIANIMMISVVVLMYTGFFQRQMEAIFLTPEFISLTLSKSGEAFFLYTGIDINEMVEFLIKFIKFSVLLTSLIALLATFTMKHRIFSGVLFLFLAIMLAGMATEVAVHVYLLYFIVAIMLFIRKG